jgi:hypothetical protein
MLDPGKRRQKEHVEKALEGFKCAHGEPVSLNWHPHAASGWFHIEGHCEEGTIEATSRAADALARFNP